MADTKCFFGLSNVRNGTWLISIINMTICIVLGVISLATIEPEHAHNQQNDFYSRHERRMQHLETDFYFFITFFVLFLFFYVNFNLKKSTYVHTAQSINHWLVINTIFFSFYFLFVCFCTLKYGLSDIITFGIPMGVFSAYQIHVVKCFYNDELKFLLAPEQNVTQPTINGPQYVAIPSQVIPSTTYPVQTGPYIIQQVHQPTTQATPYPQQTFQFQPQQQPSHLVVQDHNIPQEYNNPPPYSPNYTKPSGSETK